MLDDPYVVHAYGVVAGDSMVELPVAGVLGAAVVCIPCGTHSVIASTLPESRFGPRCWEEHGQDAEWLASVARQHHEVLQRVGESEDVIPLRLPSVFPDEHALGSATRSMRDQLTTAFEVVQGHLEWTVKVWRTPDARVPDQALRPATGADYLRRKTMEATARDRRSEQSREAALAVHENLAMVATHSVVNPLHGRDVTGRAESMVLNAAYLVGRSVRDDFFLVADEQAGCWGPEGFLVEVTGPWPAYSFTTIRLEQVRVS